MTIKIIIKRENQCEPTDRKKGEEGRIVIRLSGWGLSKVELFIRSRDLGTWRGGTGGPP